MKETSYAIQLNGLFQTLKVKRMKRLVRLSDSWLFHLLARNLVGQLLTTMLVNCSQTRRSTALKHAGQLLTNT